MTNNNNNNTNNNTKVPSAFTSRPSWWQSPSPASNSYFVIKRLEMLEYKKREQMYIIERQKAANIKVSKKGNYCYCQNQKCNKKVKMHKANPEAGCWITIPLIASPLDENRWVCDECWNKDYDTKRAADRDRIKDELQKKMSSVYKDFDELIRLLSQGKRKKIA